MTPAELARDRESVSHILKSADRLAEVAAAGRDAFDASWVPRSAARSASRLNGSLLSPLRRLVSWRLLRRFRLRIGCCA